MAQLKNTNISDTGSLDLPVGTTAQRPGSPQQGMIRYNSTLGETEYYDGILWRSISDSNPEATGGTIVDTEIGGVPYRIHIFTTTGNSTFTVTKGGQVEYLIVAGGGGGSNRHRGGGGAGGLITGTTIVTSQSYTITVGSGGAGVAQAVHPTTGTGTNGNNSSAFGLTAIGGGREGQTGGSGGGGGAGAAIGGSGTVGQGNDGGRGSANFVTECSYCGGGGGGAGSPGTGATIVTPCTSGDGGQGIFSTIAGVSNFYAGGGGGGGAVCSVRGGFGGLGGGGNGGRTFNINEGENGTPNTGGGGGSGAFTGGTNYASGAGGSGIVVVRYRRNASTTTSPTRNVISTLPNNFNIVQDGLITNIDASNPVSYSGTGTTVVIVGGTSTTGTLFNNVTYSNENGGILRFGGGANDYLQANVNTTSLDGNPNFTVDFFVRRRTGTNIGGNGSFWGIGGTGQGNGVGGWTPTANLIHLDFYDSTRLATSQFYPEGSFVHVCWVRSGGGSPETSNVTCYVNGVSVGLTKTRNETRTNQFNTSTNGVGVVLGRLNANASSFSAPADIGAFKVYSRALLVSEVLQNFNALRARYGV